MTKKFALLDTLPDPYFTIDAGAGAVTVKTGPMAPGRAMVEVWRDGVILCRVFAASVTVSGQEPNNPLGVLKLDENSN